ncbi:MAG TPA: metallopeptidase TldD-related protein [bacterium]|nr:metallopeptidase TldD-related protein [bacterium]
MSNAASPHEGLAPITARYGIAPEDLRRTIETALSRGGDYADLYFQHTVSNVLGLEDDAVNRARTAVVMGVGVRVVKGDSTGYAFTEEMTPEALRRAAATAAEIADGRKTETPASYKLVGHPGYYPEDTGWSGVDLSKKMGLLSSVNGRLKSADSRIVKTTLSFADEESEVYVVTSDGVVRHDVQPMTRLIASCVADNGTTRETGSYNLAARDGWSFYTPERIDRLVKEAVRRTVLMFEAIVPQGGEMPVVLGAGSSGILLHEAIGHGMEADFNRKGTSTYATRMGKPIAEKFVNVVDDATLAKARGSIHFDDEGNPVEKTRLVTDGVLTSYLHDRISAKHYGVKSTGSGRRESFRCAPMPRMRSTYMENGPHKAEEIVRSVKKGIFCESFSNGQVNIGAGDFTFFVKTGYLIEDGKLTRPIKDTNIIGNGPEVLQKITMVADDLVIDEGGWTCGKNGQSVPVSQGMPTVKVSSITVGGRS